jgi:hypothetical protein
MAKLKESFFLDDNLKLEAGEDVVLEGFFERERCKSGVGLNTYFPKRKLRIDGVCALFFFTPNEVALLKDPEKGKTFFENFITGEQYGI